MKKASEVYRKAAELVVTGHPEFGGCGYSCIAIDVAACVLNDCDYSPGSIDFYRQDYEELFTPPPKEDPVGSYEWGDLWGDTPQEQQDCRVLALLFMAEIAKGEGQ